LFDSPPQPAPSPHKAVKPRMVAMPRGAFEEQTVLPAFLVDIEAHVDIPALPIPDPARVRDLSIGDVDG
jgi:hypothetical protein